MAEEKIDFVKEEEQAVEQEMTPEDFQGGKYLKNKPVGEALTFVVDKIVNNKVTSAVNKLTGKTFNIGLKDRHGNVKRNDIHTEDGIYTIGSWEVYFKLLAQDGLLMAYATAHNNSFKGAKVSITRNLNGGHSQTPLEDLMKILSCNEADAKVYQDKIREAIKNKTLFDIKVE